MKHLFSFLMLFAFIMNAKAQPDLPSNWGQRKEIHFKELENNFAQPDMIYAPFAFWFWDTKLDPQHTAGMAEEMCRQRLNPGYAHARKGLPHDEWLSSLWFESFESALKKAEEANAYLGYCDEYWWPSGRADGRVLEAHPELAAVSLRWDILSFSGKKQVNIPESFFTVAAQVAESVANLSDISMTYIKIKSSSLQIIGSGKPFSWQVPEGTWRIYVFNKYHHAGWDGGDVNYLDRRLPEEFIKIAHVPYADKMGERIGKSISGVFVDNEGDYGWKLAWSDDLASEYKGKKGRDIRLWMPLIFEKDFEGLWPKARWDWYNVISDLYTDNYLGSVSRWLESHGMYDISNLWEESLRLQALTVGNFFQAQRAVTMPGNDCLIKKGLDVHDFKETQSVTEFENKRFQSEIMGVAGWQMSPVLVKKITNSVITWGVSHIVPHGINLSRELQQIPYPPDWFTSNPYWQYFHLWTDFARRASYVNSHGHFVPDVLLLNPMSSVWPLLGEDVLNTDSAGYRRHTGGTQYEKTISNIESVYKKAIHDLTDSRIEYLIADEYYLDRMNVKQNGQLVINSFNFKSLVLPSLVFLPLRTARKIVDFAEAGGYVYILGKLPVGSTDNGLNDKEMKALISKLLSLPTVKEAREGIRHLVKEEAPWLTSQAEFKSGEFEMLEQHRQIDGKDFFWFVNNTKLSQECTLMIRDVKGLASKWDCETGRKETIAFQTTLTGSRIHLKFRPFEAYWVVFDPGKRAKENSSKKPEHEFYSDIATLNGLWKIQIDTTVQPVRIWPKLGAPEDLVKKEGKYKMLGSWADWGLDRFSGYVDYTNPFISPVGKEKMILDLGEAKHMAEVWINGKLVGARLWPSFKFEISDFVQKGENNIKVRIGNLICNGMQQDIDRGLTRKGWGWDNLKPEDFDAGLFGPVVVRMQK